MAKTKPQAARQTYPITPEDLIAFRELLCADIKGVTEQRKALALLLGKNPLSLWRYESGQTISDGVVIRRALVQIADERGVTISQALRYGRPRA